MKDLTKYAGKRMPYAEADDYVARLIDRCADNAVSGKRNLKRHPAVVKWLSIGISAAAVLIAGVLVFPLLSKDKAFDSYHNSMPLSEVLSSMSDEDLMCVSYYELDDLTEYNEE